MRGAPARDNRAVRRTYSLSALYVLFSGSSSTWVHFVHVESSYGGTNFGLTSPSVQHGSYSSEVVAVLVETVHRSKSPI